jgi:hypothetical protein
MLKREFLSVPELPALTVAGIAHSAITGAVEAPRMQYVPDIPGMGGAVLEATVGGSQTTTNGNPTTNTSGTTSRPSKP